MYLPAKLKLKTSDAQVEEINAQLLVMWNI